MEAAVDPGAFEAPQSGKGSISRASNEHSNGFQYSPISSYFILMSIRFEVVSL